MISIEIKKREKDIKIKSYANSSDFFSKFSEKIDTNDLALFNIICDKIECKLDFTYDFLSLYDFIYKAVDYVISGILTESFIICYMKEEKIKLKFKIQKMKILLFR